MIAGAPTPGTAARTTLPAAAPRALAAQAVLLAAAAVALPALAHLAGLPVRALLPMHWPVLLAGLVYGWRAGGAVGALAPVLSFLVSGFPLPAVLPAMTLELTAYGLLAGLARQVGRWKPVTCVAVALAGGRALFVAAALATGVAAPSLTAYLEAALLPGLPAALAQIVLLPPLSIWWVGGRNGR